MQGLPIASGATVALSTTESANQVQNTYDYVVAGTLYLYARGSAATVLANLFVQGNQVCRNLSVPWFGTTGSLDTSAHLVSQARTLGGRVELTFRATTGTPTVDYVLTHDAVAFGGAVARLFGRTR